MILPCAYAMNYTNELQYTYLILSNAYAMNYNELYVPPTTELRHFAWVEVIIQLQIIVLPPTCNSMRITSMRAT